MKKKREYAKSSVICILTYCIITPIYFIVLSYNMELMKVGAYLLVFHGDRWEKRLHEINGKNIFKRHDSAYRYSFLFASLGSSILFFCFLDYENIGNWERNQIVIYIGNELFVQSMVSGMKR